MMNALRSLATRKIWRFPIWAYVVTIVVVAAAVSGGGSDAEPSPVASSSEPEPTESASDPEPTESASEPSPAAELADFSTRSWESQIDEIAASDASPISKGDAVDALAREYSMTPADITEQTAYLVEQVQSRAIINRSDDKEFMFSLMFIGRAIDRAVDDGDERAEDAFAFDAYQVALNLARETEGVDSSFIQANLEQLDDAIAENGW